MRGLRRALVSGVVSVAALVVSFPADLEAGADDDPVVSVEEIAGSPIRLVRASAELDSSPMAILAVIDDVERYASTFPYVSASRVVERTPTSILAYQRLHFPVTFIDDRDYVIRMTADSTMDAAGHVTHGRSWVLEPTPAVPEIPGVVRVGVNEGRWTIVPTAAGTSRVTYCLFTDPGGGMWKWVVNQANVRAVPGLFRALREAAKTSRYAAATDTDVLTAAEAGGAIRPPTSSTPRACAR